MLLQDLAEAAFPPCMTRLADDVLLLTLPDDTMNGSGAATPLPVAPPYGTVAVTGPDGPHRIAAARLPQEAASGGFAWIAARCAASGLLPPTLESDAADLIHGLDAPSRRRLLAFLLGFCRTAFGLSANPAFARDCTRLARLCARDGGDASPVAHATASWTVVAGLQAPDGASLYVLGPDHVRLGTMLPMDEGTGLRLVDAVRPGDIVLALGEHPVFWTLRGKAGSLPDMLHPSRPATPATQALRTACLRALAPADARAAALLRETQLLSPAAARRHHDPAQPLGAGLDLVLPDGEGGLFLRGWLRDPLDLVAGAELRTRMGCVPITPDQMHWVRRPDIAKRFARAAFRDDEREPGFVVHVPDPSAGTCAQPALAVRLRSGNVVEVTAPIHHLPPAMARDAVLSCVPPADVTPLMLDTCLAPAAAALHRRALLRSGDVACVRIGIPVRQPATTIIVPLYRNLDFLRFQVAALAADAQCRKIELIYVLDSPEQRAEAEHLLRGLHLLHAMPMTLLVMPRNLGYAAANNAGAAAARGDALLLLNSDVVPAAAGWLGAMRTALSAHGVGAVGPKLLFDDDSIQHAGLYFERDSDGVWFNAHYHKGMPRRWPAAQRRRKVPGVTGAALLVRRSLFETVGGICEDYIIGDYEDSDFCLRLRQAGATIAYVPDAELYHFERRSIRLHAGYARTLAGLYNRRLHHRRWDDAIEALMGFRLRSAA